MKGPCQGIYILILFLLISFSAQAHEGHEKKIKMYTKQIQKNPLNPENYYLRGVQYQSHGDFEEARSDFFKVLSLKSEHKYVDFNLALLYLDQNVLDTAMVYANNYLKKSPEDFKAYHLRGQVLNKNKKYQKASEAYKQAIQKSKNPTIELYYSLSENYKDAGDFAEARQSLLKGMEDIGPILPLRESLINLEVTTKNWVNAHCLIDDIIDEMNRKEVWYVLKADVFSLQGEDEDARKYYLMAQEAIDRLKPNLKRKKNIKNLEAKIASIIE